ncbi:ParA family protein [Xylophilus sp. ASV27]|uniref:ParA family protein n=1 Tax=Xylophilus sp. ASV27 TaxID=2795129 RepID=UPI0018ED635D|nr:ParA family protein [Xylophilus sp. ASV27]
MPVVVVANPKGGVGKSTLATHIAGHYARQGHAVMLGDVDRQQSSRFWLGLRPPQARPISTWEASGERLLLKPPRGTTHAVLDTPAGLHGWRSSEVFKLADKIVVPLQASVFDIFATRDFLDELTARTGRQPQIGIVGMRVDPRTIAADHLREFVESLGLPLVTMLRSTQNYVHLAARGLTLFDVTPTRVEKDLAQWAPLQQWLDG